MAGLVLAISRRNSGRATTGVEGVYDRHAYTEEKAAALQALARLVHSILNPSEVPATIPLRAAWGTPAHLGFERHSGHAIV